MGDGTISILVPAKKSKWVEVIKSVIYVIAAAVIVIVYYNLIMQFVFPGMVKANLMPATLDFGQGFLLAFGLWAFGKARSFIDRA